MSEEYDTLITQADFDAFKKERNERLHRFFVKVVVIFALLGVTVSVTLYYVYRVSQRNQTALCTARANAEDQIAQTEAFIKKHPLGIAGISVDELRRGIQQAVRTRDALKDLHCKESGDK